MTRIADSRVMLLAMSLVVLVGIAAEVRAETTSLPFYENFEPVPPASIGGGWWDSTQEWNAFNIMGDKRTVCSTGTVPPDNVRFPWDDLALRTCRPPTVGAP